MNSNMEKPYVVGIDIGGTNTVFGIVDARGTIIASSSIKTAEEHSLERRVPVLDQGKEKKQYRSA